MAEVTEKARPFLKWAGGKGQLLEKLDAYIPKALSDGKIENYYEPFLGGGAMFFHVMQNYPVKSAYLMDANEELVLVYNVVQKDVEALIDRLSAMGRDFLRLGDAKRKERFLKIRAEFNAARAGMDFKRYREDAWVARAAQILFLNKTCYNGLFRVNRSGGFNVPFGRYQKPSIVDPENLRRASALLAKAKIRLGDFGDLARKESFVKPGSFIYYDPPYRPISKTANFNAYSKGEFGDAEQRRLADMFKTLHKRGGVYQMLSNSDPKNIDPRDDFFEMAYDSFRNTFYRVPASRFINSNAARRGKINEIVVTNYKS